MEIIEVSQKEYDYFFKDIPCFNKASFNELNSQKCEEVHYLFFKDKKVRLGFIYGKTGKNISSPFSAPFGGFSTNKSKIRIEYIDEAVDLLENYFRENGIESAVISLPPLFYDDSFITKSTHVLYRNNWILDQLDLNYYYVLEELRLESGLQAMTYSARKNYIASTCNNLHYSFWKDEEHLSIAFEIIEKNRAIKGYPLSMTKNQMLETSKVVPVESMLVSLDEKFIGGAIIYMVTDTIPQVVYWGDDIKYSGLRTMNFLSYNLFSHYYEVGFKMIDVGTAMIGNLPNYGLCEFKESLGCKIQPRITFKKEFK
jgi:hypothetical protein